MKAPWLCRNRDELVVALNSGQSVTYLLFWGHSEGASVTKACLSQWYPSVFEDEEGATYLTAEHYMMAGKARLFEDEEALEAILASVTPAEAKKWGRKVRGFDERVWRAHRFELVVQGNIYKFGQNEELGQFLAQTGQDVLVEASPRDRIWGIGMSASHEHVREPANWRGANLLGFALMEAREVLAEVGW